MLAHVGDLIREAVKQRLFKSARVRSQWEQVQAPRYNVITFLWSERGEFAHSSAGDERVSAELATF